MGTEIIGDGRAESRRVLDGTVQVETVFPMDDRSGDEAQAGRTKALVLEGPVSNFALAWKNTARWSALLGLALLGPGWLGRRTSGSESHCKVNGLRSILPTARKARDSALLAPAAETLRRITDGITAPASIEACSRMSSVHWLAIEAVSTSPINGSSNG